MLSGSNERRSGRLEQVMLAGVAVSSELVEALASLARDAWFEETAETLERALASGQMTVALTIADREAILRLLEDPSDELARLRGVLLCEHEWRRREGL